MKVKEVREIAQKMKIQPGKLTKTALIKTIQTKEGNWPCFETASSYCDQSNCLWRSDCLH